MFISDYVVKIPMMEPGIKIEGGTDDEKQDIGDIIYNYMYPMFENFIET